jgi:hypothetical protein
MHQILKEDFTNLSKSQLQKYLKEKFNIFDLNSGTDLLCGEILYHNHSFEYK